MRPSHINILGHKVRVLDMPEQCEDGILGYCDVAQESIFVKPNQEEGSWQATLCHEFVHYAGADLALDLTEAQVSGIGSALYSAGIRIR